MSDDGFDDELGGGDLADGAFVGAAVRSPVVACRNCGAAVTQPFCGGCGQRRELRPLALTSLLWELFVEVLDSDARLWRTLRSLLRRPGELTRAWAEGQRARFMPPFRLYLVLNVLAFLVLSTGLDPNLGFEGAEERETARARITERLAALEDRTGPDIERRRAALRQVQALLDGPSDDPGANSTSVEIVLLEEQLAELPDNAGPGVRAALQGELTGLRAASAQAAGDADSADPEEPPLQIHIGKAQSDISLGGVDDWLASLGYPRDRMQAALDRITADPVAAFSALFERLPILMMLLLPFVATAMRGMYLLGRPWVVHLVGLVHLHAFVFLSILFMEGFAGFGLLLDTLGAGIGPESLGTAAGWAAAIALPVYTQLWVRNLYGHGHMMSVAVAFLLLLLHFIGAVLGLVGIVLATFLIEVIFRS